MRRLDESNEDSWIKVNLTGHSGTGKTWFGTSAPKPLILLSEYQGLASIQSATVEREEDKPMVLFMESTEDYRRVVRALSGSRDKPFVVRNAKGEALEELPSWPDTIVLDSLTDALDMVRRELLAEAPPEKDKQGLEDESFKHRRAITDRCSRLIKAFRNAPAHVVFLSLLDEKDVYRNRQRVGARWSPVTPSKDLAAVITAAVNICGVTYRKDGKYGVMLEGPDWTPTKLMSPLRAREIPDFSNWVARVRGHWEGPAPDEPPDNDGDEDLPSEEPSIDESSIDSDATRKTRPSARKGAHQ